MLYKSTKGDGKAVNFEQAILAGYAPDGGLYVPESLPQINVSQLNQWRNLSYKKLAFNILSFFFIFFQFVMPFCKKIRIF